MGRPTKIVSYLLFSLFIFRTETTIPDPLAGRSSLILLLLERAVTIQTSAIY